MPTDGRFQYTFENLAQTMGRFTEALNLERFAIYVFDYGAPVGLRMALTGCGKSRHFGKTVMKWARNGNSGLIKSVGYEGIKKDQLGSKHHRPTFSAAC